MQLNIIRKLKLKVV